jgi:hypothetical protein
MIRDAEQEKRALEMAEAMADNYQEVRRSLNDNWPILAKYNTDLIQRWMTAEKEPNPVLAAMQMGSQMKLSLARRRILLAAAAEMCCEIEKGKENS